jgi:hypothetical protein
LLLCDFVLQFLGDVVFQADCDLFCDELINFAGNILLRFIIGKNEERALIYLWMTPTLFLYQLWHQFALNMFQNHCVQLKWCGGKMKGLLAFDLLDTVFLSLIVVHQLSSKTACIDVR